MMNREIKFRAWHTKAKKMFSAEEMGADQLTIMPDGNGFVNVNGSNTRLSQLIPEMIPMQFTGLPDDKGREVFEGDIYFTEDEQDSGDIRELWIVVWIKEWCRFSFLHLPGEYDNYLDSGIEHFDYAMRESYIIELDELKGMHYKGNLFENPELLRYDAYSKL